MAPLSQILTFIESKFTNYSAESRTIKPFVKFYHRLRRTRWGKCLLGFIRSNILGRTMMIALTSKCQCSCRHCGITKVPQSKQKELSSQEIFALIDNASKFNVRAITFSGGEPLLVPNLLKYIEKGKKQHLIVTLDTNGFLLKELMVQQLKKVKLDYIGVSLDASNAREHNRLRGVEGIFEKAVEGIKLCRDYGIRCFISTYVMKDNLRNGEISKIISLARQLQVKLRLLSPICSGKFLNKTEYTLSATDIVLLRSFLEPNIVYWERREIDDKNSIFYCSAVNKKLIYVSAYGDVQPCCFMPISFGNIKEEKLEDILTRMWSSKLFSKGDEIIECPTNDESFRSRFITANK